MSNSINIGGADMSNEKPSVTKNCLLCGVGGQGTVLASKLLAAAAMAKGKKVRTAETIGMSQRGGCVVSHVRIGNEIFSPLIPHGQANVLIAFEPSEAVRCLPFLKDDGLIVLSKKTIQPVTASLTGKAFDSETMINYLKNKNVKLIVIDTDAICEKLKSTKITNTILLGAALKAGNLDISLEEIEDAIKKRVAPKFHELNIAALKAGAALAGK